MKSFPLTGAALATLTAAAPAGSTALTALIALAAPALACAQTAPVRGTPDGPVDPLLQGVDYSLDSRISAAVQALPTAETAPTPAQANAAAQASGFSIVPVPVVGLKAAAPAKGKAASAPPPVPDSEQPVHATADRMQTIDEHVLVLDGKAELTRGSARMRGDRIQYDRDLDEVSADGHVRVIRDRLTVDGPSVQMRIDANEGTMPDVSYSYSPTQANGRASRLNFVGPAQYQAENATYSTCSPFDPDWIFRAGRIDIDDDRKVGTGQNGWLYFFGVPIIASPSFDIPLDNERKSGALAPLFGYNTLSGLDLTAPYYFNIAPNRDLTVYPRLLATRGFQLGGQFRYLEPSYSGTITGDYLPGDRTAGRDRWSYGIKQRETFLPGLTGYVDYTRVSDDAYPFELGRGLSAATQLQFNQEIGLNYANGPWSALGRIQQFQTLQPNLPPYAREPQLNLRYARRDDSGISVSAEGDVTRFLNPINIGGNRAYFKPEASYTYRSLAAYVTPKVSLNATAYSLDGALTDNASPHSITRVLPTFSVDSGVVFERDAAEMSNLFGRTILQTLEPRLFYVYTPFRDQSNIPIFDTADTDFGMAQIFSENPFSGNDRIADNNKVTAGVTSRFIETDTGLERARFTIAQRFDLTGQRVTIGATNQLSQPKYSDLLLEASVKPVPTMSIDSAIQYNMQNSQLERANFSTSWRPGGQRVINVAYRYQSPTAVLDNTTLRQFQVSAQWPLRPRLYGVARANYDIEGRSMVDSLAGFEYVADCWLGRMVVQRFAGPVATGTTTGTTSTTTTTGSQAVTQIMFQIEFKGLSKLDATPVQVLRMNIPGYSPPPPPPGYATDADGMPAARP